MIMFWATQHQEYSKLADLAEDLIACPASQANVSFLFASAGSRNCMSELLQLNACQLET